MLDQLPDNLVLSICEALFDPRDVNNLSRVSKRLRSIAQSDDIWRAFCLELWKDKVYNPVADLNSASSRSCGRFPFKYSYYRSILLAKCHIVSRNYIVGKENGWSFRFSESAGEEWISSCPWQANKEALLISFSDDGNMIRAAGGDYEIDDFPLLLQWNLSWSGGKAKLMKYLKGYRARLCKLIQFANIFRLNYTSTIYSSNSSNICSSNNSNIANFDLCEFEKDVLGDFVAIKSPSPPSSSSSSSRNSVVEKSLLANIFNSFKYGDCIKVYIEKVQAPTYFCEKSPTQNWGFMFTSCWAVYSSFPLPLRGSCPVLEDYVDREDRTRQRKFDKEITSYNNQMAMRVNPEDFDENDDINDEEM